MGEEGGRVAVEEIGHERRQTAGGGDGAESEGQQKEAPNLLTNDGRRAAMGDGGRLSLVDGLGGVGATLASNLPRPISLKLATRN